MIRSMYFQKRRGRATAMAAGLVLLTAMLVCATFFPGCATGQPAAGNAPGAYLTHAYQVLTTAKTSYNLAKSAAVRLYKAGAISDADKIKVIEISNKFTDIYTTAVDALIAYEKMRTAQNDTELSDALSGVADVLTEILDIVGSEIAE